MDLQLPFWFEVGSIVVLILIVIADLVLAYKRPHIPSTRESAIWIGFYVGLALVFALLMFLFAGAEHAGQFIAGWLTEYSLSIDNLFVFIIIMARFAVPREQQQRVLMVGIVIALVLRGAFILAGAAVIAQISWVFYLFGAFLIYTAVKLVIDKDDDDDEYTENRMVRLVRRFAPIHSHYDGPRVRTTVEGRRMFTPMIVVFVAIGTTDVLFALDSIPAIFGLTRDPFIVFATNVFALMGLRQLYFLLGGLLDRLVFLPYGLAVILGFIGVKLVLETLHGNALPFINGGEHLVGVPEVPIWLSLVVIFGALLVTTVASLWHERRRPSPAQ